jgi:hypothetical protein
MTVMVSSPEPPVIPGTTPHPTAIDAHATTAPAKRALALTFVEILDPVRWGRTGGVVLVRRLPVMDTHDSVTSLTCV